MSFVSQMTDALPVGMAWPAELLALFDWLESQGHVQGGEAGLTPAGVRPHDYDGERDRLIVLHGTAITFFPGEGPWGAIPPERVFVFARSGGEGSRLALWRNEAGACRVVHLGSGSGSVWYGCVGQSPLDLLRLLAIGYPEIAFPEAFNSRPDALREAELRGLNEPFRAWLAARFGVETPERGVELCPQDPCWDDQPSEDPFWRFLDENRG